VQPAWTRRLAIAEPIAPAETTAMDDIGTGVVRGGRFARRAGEVVLIYGFACH
jgi:hypothetical protein